MPEKTSLNLGMTKTMSKVRMPTATTITAQGENFAAVTLPVIVWAFFRKFSETLQDDFENTAEFACLDHVDEEAIENIGLLRQGFGKCAASFNRKRQFAKNNFESAIAFLFFENAQSAQKRKTGVHQRGKLACESGEDFRFDAAAQKRNLDLNIHRALFAFGLFTGRSSFFAASFFFNFFRFENFGGEKPHFFHTTDGLVLAGDINDTF